MKYVLLVEGKSEKDAIPSLFKRWLDPQLDHPVGIQIVKFNGFGSFEKDVVKKARAHLNGPKQSRIIAVVGLLDLYGPNFYPDHTKSSKQRYDWGKQHFENQVGDPRFRMFFAVHEFEAWLLSQPQNFPREVQDALPGKIDQPERVNFNVPPGKLLNKIYKEKTKRSYKKTTHGKKLFDELDPDIAVKTCPYLKSLLQELLSLAKPAES